MSWPPFLAEDALSGGAAGHLLRDVYDRQVCAEQRGMSFATGEGSTAATDWATLTATCWRVPAWAGGRALTLMARFGCTTGGGGYVRLRDADTGNVGAELRVADAGGFAVFKGKPATVALALPAGWAGSLRALQVQGKCDSGTASVYVSDWGVFANARIA